MAQLSAMLAIGALAFAGGYLVAEIGTRGRIPRAEEVPVTIVAVNGDRTAIGVRFADGHEDGFALLPETPGGELVSVGAEVILDVAIFEEGGTVVRVHPLSPSEGPIAPGG
ncbi:MAG: hypothetical protein KatS3mg013_0279 [Actinomycetota bacterium]|nr:MAG: hypothetical protein KatS3mg013_0279 [Actinomycetota bacterium]